MKKVLVTYQLPKEGFKALFDSYDVTYPKKQVLDMDDIMPVIHEYDAMLASGIKVTEELLKKAKKLKIISNYGVGYDNVNVGCATELGIAVANTPEAVTEATAEIAFGLMLAVMRRISECDRLLRQENSLKWGTMNNLGHSLYGKSLGIVGMGRIGRAVARRAAASGMKILYYNRKNLPSDIENGLGAKYLPLDELLKISDVISVHTPLTPETRGMIGEREFGLLKPSAYIINTSRGAVLDEGALIDCLKKGRIAGAGLDVFLNEPAIPEELLKMDNVVLTPHIGTGTIETRVNMAAEAAQNLLSYFETDKPQNIVNLDVFKK